MANQKLQLAGQPPESSRTIPVSNTAYVIDQALFRRNVLGRPSLLQDWTGAITAGASLVQATQNSRSFTGAVSLIRATPGQSWLEPRDRTVLEFAGSYGEVTQPSTAAIKTNIIHGGLKRDEYLNSRLYLFGSGAWDHNFSQGLDLQQTYGGGLGWTAIKTDNQELNFRASADYIRQNFTNSAFDKNLFGSTFGESYNRKFSRGVVLSEALAITPAWNNLNAYSAIGNVTLGLPLYKRFNLTLSTVDSFLNNPPPSFRKNSFQFIAGLTYSIQ